MLNPRDIFPSEVYVTCIFTCINYATACVSGIFTSAPMYRRNLLKEIVFANCNPFHCLGILMYLLNRDECIVFFLSQVLFARAMR
jgi:hypothetical protein